MSKVSGSMQIFIIGTLFNTFDYMLKNLGREFLIDQKNFVNEIIDEVTRRVHTRKKRTLSDPMADLYLEHLEWLFSYTEVLELFLLGRPNLAAMTSYSAEQYKPDFHTEEYYEEMKEELKNYINGNNKYRGHLL